MPRGEGMLPLVLSCEHGGNRVPGPWKDRFRGARDVLDSHRGWDPGALSLARSRARALDATLKDLLNAAPRGQRAGVVTRATVLRGATAFPSAAAKRTTPTKG